MILRDLAEALRQQSWFTVVLEVLVVVVGIFIGLQADSWNEGRKTQLLERQYLERLHHDISRSLAHAEENSGSMQRQYLWEERMLESLKSCELNDADHDVFSSGLMFLAQFTPDPLIRGTIDELVSTGQFGVISDIELRSLLSEIVRSSDAQQDVLSYIVQRMSPQIAYVDSKVVRRLPAIGQPISVDGVVPVHRIEFDFRASCEDLQLIAAISAIQLATRVLVAQNQRATEQYFSVIEALEKELGDSRRKEDQP